MVILAKLSLDIHLVRIFELLACRGMFTPLVVAVTEATNRKKGFVVVHGLKRYAVHHSGKVCFWEDDLAGD